MAEGDNDMPQLRWLQSSQVEIRQQSLYSRHIFLLSMNKSFEFWFGIWHVQLFTLGSQYPNLHLMLNIEKEIPFDMEVRGREVDEQ